MGSRTDPVSTVKAMHDVTVKVTNVEEAGMVMLDARQPQVDKVVMASVMDPDGADNRGHVAVVQTWSALIPTEPNTACPDAEDAGWAIIMDATAASYTPASGDATNCLRATATYKDPAPTT